MGDAFSSYSKDVEYRILQQAAALDKPIGAGFLFNALQQDNGPILSEATLGRSLRSLEQRGYLTSERYNGRSRGRVITEAGRFRLKELSLYEDRQRSVRAVMDLLGDNLDKQLRDMLVARKIVEPETAALAAQSASEEHLSAIRRILNQMDDLTAVGQSMAPTDGPFHAEIAKASGNSILESILKIARTEQDHSETIEYIIRASGHKTSSDHWSIYAAIRDHSPNKARRIMRQHISNLIQKLDEYEAEKSTRC